MRQLIPTALAMALVLGGGVTALSLLGSLVG